MKKWLLGMTLFVGLLLGVLYFGYAEMMAGKDFISVEDMTPLELELVYQGLKPDGVGSVQSMAILPDAFAIAARPRGSARQGGETNNQLILIDRETLMLTNDAQESYELGHANGMTYDKKRNRLVVVGIRDEDGVKKMVARIDARTFREESQLMLDDFGASGIASLPDGGYVIRSAGKMSFLDEDFVPTGETLNFCSGLTVQDIAYTNGAVFLADWTRRDWSLKIRKMGLKNNQNVIYRLRRDGGEVEAFLIDEPRLELESLDFADDECYVLMNGIGAEQDWFFIYRVKNSETLIK